MVEGYERDDGMEASGDARNAVARARDAAGAKSRDLLDRVVEQKDELKHRAADMADDRRLQAAGRAESISRALQGAADSLRENGEQQLSGWVSQAAGQVERVVGYMQGKPADGMLHDFEDLARRNPAMFLGGTYLAGMAVGRFLRASSPQPQHSTDEASYNHSPRLERISEGSYTEPARADSSHAEGTFGEGSFGGSLAGGGLAGGSLAAGSFEDRSYGANSAGTIREESTEQSPYRGSSQTGDGEGGVSSHDSGEDRANDASFWSDESDPQRGIS